jgi:uncharacterized membrane protein
MIRSVAAGSARLLFALGLVITILAAPATLQAAGGQAGAGNWQNGQSRQNTSNQNASVSTWQLNKYVGMLQNTLQRLTALAQSGQLNNSQLQTVNQQMIALQSALQQLTTAQQNNSTVTRSQLQALTQQLRSQGIHLQMGRSSGRR